MVNIVLRTAHLFVIMFINLLTYNIDVTFTVYTFIVQPKLYLYKIITIINCTIFYTIFAYIMENVIQINTKL